DSLFVLIADADTLFHQELFRKRFFGDEADDLFLALVIQADRSTIDCESEISALEQTRHQPMHIIFHKAIRSLHEAVLHRFHGGLDRKSTRLNSSHVSISYAVFCLKKKKM